jgi:hypothetical protein
MTINLLDALKDLSQCDENHVATTVEVIVHKSLMQTAIQAAQLLGGDSNAVLGVLISQMVEAQFESQLKGISQPEAVSASEDPISSAVLQLKDRLKFDDLVGMAQNLQDKLRTLETMLPQSEVPNAEVGSNGKSNPSSGA